MSQPLARIEVVATSEEVVGTAEADASGAFVVRLAPSADGRNLRLAARTGAETRKAIIPVATLGETLDIGAVDARTTALAQLALYEVVQEAGSTLRATPPQALFALLAEASSAPTPALEAFAAQVDMLLGMARTADGAVSEPIFDARGFEISEVFLNEAGMASTEKQSYRTLLAAAAAGFGLQIRCDPARLNVMFTVDGSGRGLDGNGAPQLIRQPTKEGRLYLGFTTDESSPVTDEVIPVKLTPNDPKFAMTDDGEGGDEVAGDGIFTVVVPLPRSARLLYKYTNGAGGEGFTGTEEWPGNARILEVEDVITGRPDGEPDCLVIRRDSFGDEATNKNFVNLNGRAREKGGTVSFDADLGGLEAPIGRGTVRVGGLAVDDLRRAPPLTPAGVPEARENGVCSVCPAPLVLDPDDAVPPVLLRADRLAVDRVRARFSEPVNAEDARDLTRWSYVDASQAPIEVLAVQVSGADVILEIEPTHPRAAARLRVSNLRDGSVRGNRLEEAEVPVGPDLTPPKIVSARSLSILELDPSVTLPDPTVGDLVELVLDEALEVSAATDATRYVIDGLEVLAAAPVTDAPEGSTTHKIRLVTEVQAKSVPYVLKAVGLRDPAGNALEQEVPFEGFGLYKTTFRVVPGFAFSDSSGASRGIPRGERLYVTGTPLVSARDLVGRDISITAAGSTRPDVTGWPAFEMTPGPDSYEGQPIYELSLLLPRGSWSWKPAHGVEGEYVDAPITLEKVHKTLATTNDATGVRVDPRTLIAENGLSYRGAKLSETGAEPPRAGVLFKREAPDEVCEVLGDVTCPVIVLGTWRDFALDANGRTIDYDDGIVTLPAYHPTLPDASAPKLLDARARDSFSVLLSFDEALDRPAETLEVGLARAEDGVGLPVSVLATDELKPHQAVVRVEGTACEGAMAPGVAYTVRYRGAQDRQGLADRRFRTQTVLAPDACEPFAPLSDRAPPRVLGVEATDLTELTVRFDERVDPATANVLAAYAVASEAGRPLSIERAELQPDGATVRLTTATQNILEPYRLTVRNIADAADPANVLESATVAFVGFGERNAPVVARARAIAEDRVLVVFDEPVEPTSALASANYRSAGFTVTAVEFAGSPERRVLAFNPALAPRLREAVLLTTSPLAAGTTYDLEVEGVRDLSGNASSSTVQLTGVAEPPTVDVVLEVEVSDTVKVAGAIPSRAISLAELQESREGLFVLGARASADQTPAPGRDAPVNDVLGGFGREGSPLDGIESRLVDNGAAPDRVGGDGVFSILIPRVPLGTTIIWKAFAPYSTTYRDRNPTDAAAAFADGLPGPSVFADGQEFPGNENGVIVLDEGATPGVVRVRSIFGDEVTYKKNTGRAAFLWLFGDRASGDRR